MHMDTFVKHNVKILHEISYRSNEIITHVMFWAWTML